MNDKAVVTQAAPTSAMVAAESWNASQLEVLRNVVCKGASDAELAFFGQVCRAKKLDPFGQQIFLVKRKGKDGDTICIQVGIDGFRAQAARSGDYAGNDEPVFKYDEGGKRPTSATVVVWRFIQGQRIPFSATARWDEFFPGENLGFMWKSKPHVMLGKCAEAQAIRKAFPNECGGLYEEAELQQVEPVHAAPAAPAASQLPASSAAGLNAAFAKRAAPEPQGPVGLQTGQNGRASPPPSHPAQNQVALATAAQIDATMDAFEKIGVQPAALAQHLGISQADPITVANLETLRLWYAELAKAHQVAGGNEVTA